MKTSFKTKSLVTTSILALAASQVVAMNGGTIVPAAEVANTGAVAISQSGSVMCSATLIAPTWVLTARHCFVPKAIYGSEGQAFAVPANGISAGANAGLSFQTRVISAGWIAPAGTPDKLRKATLTAVTQSGEVAGGFGASGYSTIVFNDAAITSSELTDIIRAPGSTDLVAIGKVERNGSEQMLVARFDSNGLLKLAPWLTQNPGATVGFTPIQGHAVRVLANDANNTVVVAGWSFLEGVPRWNATRYTAAGAVDPSFAPFFGNATPGHLYDVVKVGSHLVWLGTMDINGVPRSMIVATDLDGHNQVQLPVDATALPVPERLLAHNDNAVWVIGTDSSRIRARVLRLAVQPTNPTLTADAGWPATGAAMTQAPALDAYVHIKGAIENAGKLVVIGDWHVEHTDLAMVARFTAAGAPDLAFGQSGLVLDLNHHAQYAGAIIASDTQPMLVIGTSISAPIPPTPAEHLPDRPMFWTSAYDDGQAVLGRTSVSYAGATQAIKRVIRHDDPAVDIALLELYSPLSDDARKIAVTAFNATPIADMAAANEKAQCRGYGTDDYDETGTLRFGEIEPSASDGNNIDFYAYEPTRIRGGDSGGGCVIERDGITYLVGVVKDSQNEPTDLDDTKKPGTGAALTRGDLTDPAVFEDFVVGYVPGFGS